MTDPEPDRTGAVVVASTAGAEQAAIIECRQYELLRLLAS